MSLTVSPSYPPNGLARDHYFDSETFGNGSEIPHVECNQRIGLPINGCFQHHFITWIPQLWPPQEMRFEQYCFPSSSNRVVLVMPMEEVSRNVSVCRPCWFVLLVNRPSFSLKRALFLLYGLTERFAECFTGSFASLNKDHNLHLTYFRG